MLRATAIGRTVQSAEANGPATTRPSLVGFPASPPGSLCSGALCAGALRDGMFVGREFELGVLGALLAQVSADGARVGLVRGAAGIGKTALVHEFLHRQENLTVVRGSGDEGEATIPYALVDQLFGALGLRSAALLAHTEGVPTVEQPIVVGEQVLAVLTRLGAGGPLAVVVDDAHWADIDSLRALVFALRRLAAHPVLTVLTVPSDDWRLPASVTRLAEGHTGVTVDVGPLLPTDVQSLATAVGSSIPGLAAHRLCAHTLGNPRHVLALLAETPAGRWQDRQPVLPAPRVFSRTIRRRLVTCSDDTRRLVEAAAVLGADVALATAATLAELDEPLEALEEACSVALLDASAAVPAGSLAFPNPLVRAAVYGQLTPTRRLRLHREAARLVPDEQRAIPGPVMTAGGPPQRREQEAAAPESEPATRPTFDRSRLTAQELAVARLVAVGMSNRQVASELFISIKTVQFHLTHIYAKLGVSVRAELAARFRDDRLADGERRSSG